MREPAIIARVAICQKRPQRVLDQPRWLSVPPLPTMVFQLTGLLFPIVRRNLKGKGIGVPERGAAVETETSSASY